MRRLLKTVLFLTMLGGAASAQIPTRGNIFFGYSYDHTSIVQNDATNLNGWDMTLEGKFAPWVGVVLDIDGHYGRRAFPTVCIAVPCEPLRADVAAHNVLFGPRISVQIERFRPFAELLFGAGHISRSNGISDSNTSFVNGLGGGLDYQIAGPVSFRGQLDWINTRFYGEGQNGVRFSTGLALHF
jgi:hypothetical protein